MNYEFHPEAEREFIEEAGTTSQKRLGWDHDLRTRFIVSSSCFVKIRRSAHLWTRSYVISF